MAKLPISEFLTARLKEFDPSFELRKGTGFEQLFFKPLQFIVQPLRDEADLIQLSQSFRRILQTSDPDAFNEEAVDALANNLFVTRNEGRSASGLARVYYDQPVNREWPSGGAVFTGSNSKLYANPLPFAITRNQMGTQIENGLFYYDIAVIALEPGDDSDLEAGGLVSLAADSEVISVSNLVAIGGGRARETNTQLIERTKSSIAVRDLVTGKGFNAILFENFASSLVELQPVGMGDSEMMRDIKFNTHIGGRVDGYFKAPAVQTRTKDITGLLIDATRQARTTKNLVLSGTVFKNVGYPNIDRSGGRNPLVTQVKPSTPAVFVNTQDLTSPVDLSTNRYIKLTIDGIERNIRMSGLTASATTRNELIAFINNAFGVNHAKTFGNSFRLMSPSRGLSSEIIIDNPTIGSSALAEIFGLSPLGAPYFFKGDGPIVFVEDDHYEFNDADGEIRRVIGASVVVPQTTGVTVAGSNVLSDATPSVFTNVQPNDILTVTSGADAGDYRVRSTGAGTLEVDANFTASLSGANYYVRRTGIKDGETVFLEFFFNPVAIDIGKYVRLDPEGTTRGIRPGREDQTITDVAFLRIKQIEIIDPLTLEPTGEVLRGIGGYGSGGYGVGPYGIGSGKDYYLVVNSPNERFSAFEDSYIVINSAFQGFSFRVTYDCVPECEDLHNFVRSEQERVLDGDILMKHFLPAYVSGRIEYSVDRTDSSIPDNDTVLALLKEFINLRKSGTTLSYSGIKQFILRLTDPFDRFGARVKDFELKARIHNTDGSTTVVSGKNELVVPTLTPFPRVTPKPLSPRIAHWLADEIELVRL